MLARGREMVARNRQERVRRKHRSGRIGSRRKAGFKERKKKLLMKVSGKTPAEGEQESQTWLLSLISDIPATTSTFLSQPHPWGGRAGLLVVRFVSGKSTASSYPTLQHPPGACS